jgi:hypothetical protein
VQLPACPQGLLQLPNQPHHLLLILLLCGLLCRREEHRQRVAELQDEQRRVQIAQFVAGERANDGIQRPSFASLDEVGTLVAIHDEPDFKVERVYSRVGR